MSTPFILKTQGPSKYGYSLLPLLIFFIFIGFSGSLPDLALAHGKNLAVTRTQHTRPIIPHAIPHFESLQSKLGNEGFQLSSSTPDGTKLIAVRGGDIQVLDPNTHGVLWQFLGSKEGPKDFGPRDYQVIQVSSDGTKLSLAEELNGNVWVLDLKTGAVLSHVRSALKRTEQTLISDDASVMVQVSYGGYITLTDIMTNTIFFEQSDLRSGPKRYDIKGFTSDGKYLIVDKGGFGARGYWDLELLRRISKIPGIRNIPAWLTWWRSWD